VAVARKLISEGRILPSQTTVLCITGNGLKTLDPLEAEFPLGPALTPRLELFEEQLAGLN
jgi:threonine synthase